MIFNSFAYFILFLVPAAIVFRLARPAAQPWVPVIFGAGFFVFFSLTDIGGVAGAFCLLIFVWESLFSRFYRPGSPLCFVGIAQAIIFLVIFKYWNFFTGLVFRPTGHNPVYWAGAFLPLGISFFTFEFIHYAVDRYRGTAPRGKISDYMAFILFFPTMVAGPIKRYQDFGPKLAQPSLEWEIDWQQGVTRILVGLAKKFMLADLLTALTNHLNHHDIAQAARWVLPVWLLAYGFKIYLDFSAYSDIAIGSARLFGIKVPENFDWPYLRTNISEFWQHWHMSLYKWLVDYVFIPLGGSRTAQPRVYLNVLITMLVSGLWHGAALNFVVWGLWHGMLLMIYRAWSRWRSKAGQGISSSDGLAMNALANIGQHPSPCPLPVRAEGILHSAVCATAPPSHLAVAAAPELCCRENDLENAFELTKAQEPSSLSPHGERVRVRGDRATSAPSRFGKFAAWALTFTMVNLGWAFFCMDLHTAVYFFRRLFLG
jgi:alginate O-acetyltransferase complex protein AlgI